MKAGWNNTKPNKERPSFPARPFEHQFFQHPPGKADINEVFNLLDHSNRSGRSAQNFSSCFIVREIALKDAQWLLPFKTPNYRLTECCQKAAPPDVIAEAFEFPNHDFLFLEIDRVTLKARTAALLREVRA